MSATFPNGPAVTAEVAISTTDALYGLWDSALWDSGLWGPDEVYTDLSAYLIGFDVQRGYDQNWLWRSGTGRLIFANNDNRFDPDNPASPYTAAGFSGLEPWRAARMTATYGGTYYPIARMFTGDWEQGFHLRDTPTVEVSLRDEWARLAGMRAVGIPSTGAGDSYGARITRALDAVGHNGTRVVDTGTVTMQATTLSGDCVREMQLAADSEGGLLSIDRDGAVTALRRHAIIEDARSITSQATFGPDVGEIPYREPKRDTSTDRIVNSVNYTRVGGAAQLVEDETSISRYGYKRGDSPRTDLTCQTDAQTYSTAAWKLARFATYQRGLSEITIYPQSNPALMWPIALGLRERDLVTVKEPRAWGTVARLCYIAGVRHTARPGLWTTTFTLLAATQLVALSTSRWDVGTWGASATDTTGARWI